MNIAFCTRSDYLSVRGGDTVQLLHTRELLQNSYGANVDVVAGPEKLNAADYDLCHIFNIQKIEDTKAYLAKCCTAGVKVALSPVLWDFSAVVSYNFMVKRLSAYRLSERRIDFAARLLKLLAGVVGMPTIYTRGYREYLRQVLSAADLLLPNSLEEAEVLARLSWLDRVQLQGKTCRVVNAVNLPVPAAMAGVAEKYRLPSGYILQVGRIEPGKNQYSTIKALMDETHLPILFVGNQRVNPAYFRATEALGRRRGNVYFIDEIPHEELPLLYRNAAVHVLPSLGETTGLVSLEALGCGCRAVVADVRYCPFESYFKGVTTSVDPVNYQSIRKGIIAELATERDMAAISSRIRHDFSWDVAARQTHEAYERLLAG
jgi:glycosyltransferase involved in cell wall biosynthesis